MGFFLQFFMTWGGWIISLALLGVLSVILALTKPVTFPMLAAKLRGKSLVLMQRLDGRYGLLSGVYSNGAVDLGRYGIFNVDRESFKHFGGTTLAPVLEGYGVVPDSKVIAAANEVYKEGYEDLEAILADTDRLREVEENGFGKEKTKATHLLQNLAVIEKFNRSGLSTVQVQDKIDHEVKKRLNRHQSNPMVKVLMFAVVIIAMAVVLAVFFKMQQCPTAQDFVQLANTCSNAADNLNM